MFRAAWLTLPAVALFLSALAAAPPGDAVKAGFLSPPDTARPGVYWYFMDGNLDRAAITADLESMKAAGIGYALFLEVNVGVPRGRVNMLSPEWQELFAHAIHEAERLGIRIIVGSGPGWAGSGGPWVKPAQSMMHLVASTTDAKGPGRFDAVLPVPPPKPPFFGEASVPPDLKALRDAWYEDVAVLAVPTPRGRERIESPDDKALYYRAPYTSQPGVVPYFVSRASYPATPAAAIASDRIVDLTAQLQPGGRLGWDVPAGEWTILRFVKRNNGAVTRPAPAPGLGFESDKLSVAAFDAHFDAFLGTLVRKVGLRATDDVRLRPDATDIARKSRTGGWTTVHIDSWEMGAQNWTDDFRAEFQRRRGYDPLRFLPAYTGLIVGTLEQSERFLWDVRQTASELIVERHARRFKELGRRYGFDLSIEPYDMNPAADLDLGSVADVPMGEFWSDGFGFNSAFSVVEAASIGHVLGRPVVAAEAFTADHREAWKLYPGALKNQGDWAFAAGINRFVYHTFAHKPYGDRLKPGVTMGPYGVHWDRGQTWWPMAADYHRYIARSQFLLSQGHGVADILYLAAEGAPHVFRPPASAMDGTATLPDKKAFAFDGCSPKVLVERASVRGGRIVFPGGASYRVLVLPIVETMTPELLAKIEALIRAGAVVIGGPPHKSPSLAEYPRGDAQVRAAAERVWGGLKVPAGATWRKVGAGTIYWGGDLSAAEAGSPYPTYDAAAHVLEAEGVRPDVRKSAALRCAHRSLPDREIYFASNRTAQKLTDRVVFRDGTETAELWDAVTGRIVPVRVEGRDSSGVALTLRLDAWQSVFVVFEKGRTRPGVAADLPVGGSSDPVRERVLDLTGPWTVSFDPKWGGPERIAFERLEDWSERPEDGIRYYSGIATYAVTFDLPETTSERERSRASRSEAGAAVPPRGSTGSPRPELVEGRGEGRRGSARPASRAWVLDLGVVENLARVRLNGRDLGVVWTAPWEVSVGGVLKLSGNRLEIEVANLWVNRLIGDERYPDDGVKDGRWPQWVLDGTPRPSPRFTFTTHPFYKQGDPLQPSGLLGPVTLWTVR